MRPKPARNAQPGCRTTRKSCWKSGQGKQAADPKPEGQDEASKEKPRKRGNNNQTSDDPSLWLRDKGKGKGKWGGNAEIVANWSRAKSYGSQVLPLDRIGDLIHEPETEPNNRNRTCSLSNRRPERGPEGQTGNRN